jgi:hypothetical protein
MNSDNDAYDELCAYTLTRGDADFVHQHVVDARTAQLANATTKPIGIFFALVGLYLHVEHGWTGRQVQRAHMALARRPEPWPVGPLPSSRGEITASDVMAVPAGPARDAAISRWAAAVWGAFAESRERVHTLLARRGIL